MKNIKSLLVEVIKAFFKFKSFVWFIVVTLIIQLVNAQNLIKISVGNNSNFVYIIFFLVILLIGDIIFDSKIWQFFKIKILTPLDTFIFGGIITSLFNLIILQFQSGKRLNIQYILKNLLPCILFICLIGFSILAFKRVRSINKNDKSDSNEKSSYNELFELKELNKGPIGWDYKEEGPILVDEHAVDYDLLNRQTTEEQVIQALQYFNESHNYTVGIVGKWGSGKTTLLKNVKQNMHLLKSKDIVFVPAPGTQNQDIDLWLFQSQRELIAGIYDAFFNSLGIEYGSSQRRSLVNSTIKIVSGLPLIGSTARLLVPSSSSYSDLNQLKSELIRYIKSSNKHYIMCIENMDRANKKQITLLLKLLNTVLDLPDVTFVLLYDKERLNKILDREDEIDGSFAEKVINQEVILPSLIDRNVTKEVLNNLLKSYQIDKVEEYKIIIETIANNITTLRELKRIINSVFSVLSLDLTYRLNLGNILAIQYIYFSKPELYEELKRNKDYLVLGFNPFDVPRLSKEQQNHIANLCSRYPEYKSLLTYLFPCFKVYDHIPVADNRHKVARKSRLICYSGYFDCYFLLQENYEISLSNYLSNFVQRIQQDPTHIDEIYEKEILNHKLREEFLRGISLYLTIADIPSLFIREQFAEVLVDSLINSREKYKYWEISILIDCISLLIGEIDDEQFIKFKNFVLCYDESLYILNEIYKYMKNKIGDYSDNFLKNRDKIQDLVNLKRKEVLESKGRINLYKFSSYNELCIGPLIYNEKNPKQTSIYIKSCISKESILRILQDSIKLDKIPGERIADKEERQYIKLVSDIYKKIIVEEKNRIEQLINENNLDTDENKNKITYFRKIIKSEN